MAHPVYPAALTSDAEVWGGDRWLSTAEAHRASGVAESTFRVWARTGRGPITPRRLGRKWLWKRSDIERLLAA